jgi:hypothetical protein
MTLALLEAAKIEMSHDVADYFALWQLGLIICPRLQTGVASTTHSYYSEYQPRARSYRSMCNSDMPKQ